MSSQTKRFFVSAALAGGLTFGLATPALGQEASVEADTSTSSPGAPRSKDDRSAFLAAGKAGAVFPLNGLDPFVRGGVELGWVFGGTGRRMAALLDVSYTAPHAAGVEKDSRVADGRYEWELRQKELVFQPTFLYRLTGESALTPFVGIGPRIYFLESVGKGSAAGSELEDTYERSTKLGVGLPFGLELRLGPGGLFAEALLEWGPLDHRITGDSSLLAANLFLGYRALL